MIILLDTALHEQPRIEVEKLQCIYMCSYSELLKMGDFVTAEASIISQSLLTSRILFSATVKIAKSDY
jgi:hypothetical protein